MNTKEVPVTLGDYLGVLRRRRWYLLTIIPAALLMAVYLAYTLPAIYRSSATILLQPALITQEGPKAAVRNYADHQIELVQRRVLIADNLEPIVADVDPYPDRPELSARDKANQVISDTVIERVDPITLEVLPESDAFSIHYHNADPEIAAAIARRISELFLNYNRQTRSERADETYRFLQSQVQEVERNIGDVDRRIAAFKSRHGAALPESQVRNQAAAERAAGDLQNIQARIRAAEERQALLTVQLSRLNPLLGSTSGNLQTELAMLQGQLADARVRYTPDHPDVKRLQRQIEALSAKAATEPATGGLVPNNPEYVSVQSQLESVQREIAALQANAGRAQGLIYQYEAGRVASPAVETEYAELMRERDMLSLQFGEVQGKLRDADLARNIETEEKGDRFEQIRNPRVADKPFSPNRLGIMLLGIVLGGGLAVGLAALAESSDSSVRSTRDLGEITGIPVIASVPLILNDEDRRVGLLRWGSYASALLVASALVVVAVARA